MFEHVANVKFVSHSYIKESIVKLSDLFEAPVVHLDGQHLDKAVDLYQSDAALNADFLPLFSIHTSLGEIRFLMKKSPENSLIRGVVRDQDTLGRATNRVIFQLKFKANKTIVKWPEDVDPSSALQVNSVFISDDYRKLGIASKIYRRLVSKGFVIISDAEQFTDGKELWKKLVRDTAYGEYRIYILDDEYGFEKDEKGRAIAYDGSNIKDSKIWTSGEDLSGFHKLLVMKAN